MKVLVPLLALSASVAQAHYTFPSIIYAGVTTPVWKYVRQWTGYYTYNPVTDVSLLDIRCNVNGTKSGVSTSTLSVAAGSKLGFTADPNIYHPGPLQVYMAKVPTGSTASSWDGSGSVWFKILQLGPNFGSSLTWPTDGVTSVSFNIPAATPSGEYLVRVEHIALHSASAANGAQFYISCGQVSVTGGGSGNPGPLVAFPGAYKPTDPGLLINIYYPVPTTYTFPGPTIWTG